MPRAPTGRSGSAGCRFPADWQDAVIRAAITLKLCTYEDTGAVVAALTTSIPEHADSGRNWDYRYCWLRDAYFVVKALNRLGATQTMEGYLHFIDHIVARGDGAGVQPLYGLSGDAQLPERVEPALDGYRGMGPVRVGNQAFVQQQHDVYGSAILACTQLFFDHRLTNPGDVGALRAAPAFRQACRAHRWRRRRRPVGVPRSRAAAHLLERDELGGMRSTRPHRRVARPRRPSGRTGVPGRSASAIACSRVRGIRRCAPLLRAKADRISTRPRCCCRSSACSRRTTRASSRRSTAIERELRAGDWLYRYRHVDDFGHPATAFTVCGFWYVQALAAVGRREEARERFDRMLAGRTRLGLLSEDIDPASGELWGNFPQTYSMVGIVSSAVRLSRSWEDLV